MHGFPGVDVAADEHGNDAAFTVGVSAEVEHMLVVAVAEDVGLPVRAAHKHLQCGCWGGPTWGGVWLWGGWSGKDTPGSGCVLRVSPNVVVMVVHGEEGGGEEQRLCR